MQDNGNLLNHPQDAIKPTRRKAAKQSLIFTASDAMASFVGPTSALPALAVSVIAA